MCSLGSELFNAFYTIFELPERIFTDHLKYPKPSGPRRRRARPGGAQHHSTAVTDFFGLVLGDGITWSHGRARKCWGSWVDSLCKLPNRPSINNN
jgi:hypothetical protein